MKEPSTMQTAFFSTPVFSTERRSKTMRTSARAIATAFAAGACFAPFGVLAAFNSGSTGTDGPFSPTVSTTLTLPPSGIFNFTSVNVPAGVTVTFLRNTINTPVVILATGDVTIAGTISVSGATAAGVGAAGNGAQGDDGTPGAGGPGGFDGGRGGKPGVQGFGGVGLGPGAGNAGFFVPAPDTCVDGNGWSSGGTGGGFGAAAGNSPRSPVNCSNPPYSYVQALGGSSYGSSRLLPLIGGSGGGGGGGGATFEGGGGGGGGGAILIAASGQISVATTGAVLANGGAGGAALGAGIGGAGGGGAGGAIRLIATTLGGNGTISAAGGPAGTVSGQTNSVFQATGGAQGYVRLEAETITRTAASSPIATSDLPGTVFVAGTPTLRIASVAGVNAPASPTGDADIRLPASTPNPVSVVFETSGVPVGNTVLVTVTPALGPKSTAITPALTGTTASATASVNVNLPVGPSTLSAQTTYTVVAALGDLLKNFAGNERVERVTLMATLGAPSTVKLITVSGKEYEAPAEVLRIAALGG
jgi:hypothetical protein